ncbi:MAG: glycosyltransferase [Deltaproteobacteria bacterium]|nr:glycosyltransferase [Deltaproteobacteria bacterium]
MDANDRPKLLIFIVAYNAESTLLKVLDRIPVELFDNFQTEVLVIDDASKDRTFELGLSRAESWPHCRITILQNPQNQGYGGNQKLGYEYAIRNDFDCVALLHGDGQYAPEKLPALVQPITDGQFDAVFGSRMIAKGGARKGGMPLYKYLGNKILTTFQNAFLKTELSEFHSGFRAYSTKMLRQIPFQLNSNDFHFDTDIIIQLILGGHRLLEIPIPTYYGDEVCYVNGMNYAMNVVRSTLASRLHSMGIRYQRKFDVEPFEETYDIKLGYTSSHTMAIDAVPEKSRVLDLGCGPGLVARELLDKGCFVAGLDLERPSQKNVSKYIEWDLNSNELLEEIADYEYVLLLDIIEHLQKPEKLIDLLRQNAKSSRPTIILTTANVTFAVTRLMFMLGQFNYGKKGILDQTHTRLFTFSSMQNMLRQSGYEIIDVVGIPAPFPRAIHNEHLSSALVRLNEMLIRLHKPLFSYQMYFKISPLPTVDNLLNESIDFSSVKSDHSYPSPAK